MTRGTAFSEGRQDERRGPISTTNLPRSSTTHGGHRWHWHQSNKALDKWLPSFSNTTWRWSGVKTALLILARIGKPQNNDRSYVLIVGCGHRPNDPKWNQGQAHLTQEHDSKHRPTLIGYCPPMHNSLR